MASQHREKDFDRVGGLREHIKALKEMIIYPLLYRELFEAYGIEAPRGVLFHGPPGTGKTLIAGAVVAECSKSSNRRVSFYVRKGADCLNKYVGESEKHLQNLFTQAHNTRPSIIFFDEIDGLVPTRSESREQVHSSVVSTLLALMDGLDSKSEVFIIGATNRIDMIDPALRRPGRFDRELYFPLPPLESRIQIFKIHTRTWKHKPSQKLIHKLASECAGYCGADIQALCSQAVMKCFNRNFPQVTDTTRKHMINFQTLQVQDEDFLEAKESMVPASQRTYAVPSRPLTPELVPLLQRSLDICMEHILKMCPFKFLFHDREDFSQNRTFSCPRMLLFGKEGQGHSSHIVPAILHCFDHLPVTLIDLAAINDDSFRSTESSSFIHKIEEARQTMPSIIYLKNISSWWDLIEESARQILLESVESLDVSNGTQILLLGTCCGSSYEDLPDDVQKLFPKSRSFPVPEPTKEERKQFFSQLLLKKVMIPPKVKREKSINDGIGFKCLYEPDGGIRRRSLRLRGLNINYYDSGSVSGNKPRLRSYYRRYVQDYPSRKINGKRNNRTRSACKNSGQLASEADSPHLKKFKSEPDQDTATSSNASTASIAGSSNSEESETVKVDSVRLGNFVEEAVERTAASPVDAIIRLYEDLEIVTLRYSLKWDRSSLPEELEKEISVFSPT